MTQQTRQRLSQKTKVHLDSDDVRRSVNDGGWSSPSVSRRTGRAPLAQEERSGCRTEPALYPSTPEYGALARWDESFGPCKPQPMTTSTSKLEAMVLNQKWVKGALQVWDQLLPQMEEFKYVRVLFTSEGRQGCLVDSGQLQP